MSAPRIYRVSFSEVSVSATQDLFGLLSTSSMAIRLRRIELGQKTQSSWGALGLKLVRNPATVTAGSGGSSVTPQKMPDTQAAATFTARTNDTTNQTTNGTQALLFGRMWELTNGFFWQAVPDQMDIIQPSEGLALQLVDAPGSAITASGYVEVEELY